MNTPLKTILPCLALSLLTACSTGWTATNHYDEFTGANMCRVERGTKASRDFTRGFTGIYFTQHFYAESHDGEVRAGVRTEPSLPIGGDIQIKVGEKLYTMTSKDVPLDLALSTPINTEFVSQYMDTAQIGVMKDMVKDAKKIASPYRAYTGQKAKALLRDIIQTQDEIKFRVIGVNTATSSTAAFTAGEDFTAALQKCGINL